MHTLKARFLTKDSFRLYGQVIWPTEDGVPFGENDAQLILGQGIPRFYLMRLYRNSLVFSQITHHKHCTQCLGSLGGKPWFLGVAPPSERLDPSQIVAFAIPGDCFIKLNLGTWHAGPLFTGSDPMDFYNLELADTNLVDHTTIDLKALYDLTIEIVP
jgi:ureidoglycolate hydrolase